jgi:hypothetical protein
MCIYECVVQLYVFGFSMGSFLAQQIRKQEELLLKVYYINSPCETASRSRPWSERDVR